MAHRIEKDDTMAYRMGEGKPWHGLGIPVSDVMDDEQFFAQSGLGEWDPMLYEIGMESKRQPGLYRKLDGWRAVVRSDSGKPLGVVSKDYRLVRNRDIWDFFRAFCAETGARMSTAGSLCGGRRVWGLAKLDKSFTLPGTKDKTDMYVCLSTGHDGAFATQADLTTVRVVCHNTLDATRGMRAKGGEGEKYGRFRMVHLSEWTPAAAKRARNAMQAASAALEYQHERAERLYAARVDEGVQRAYVAELFAPEIVKGILEGKWGNRPVNLMTAVTESHAEAGRRVLDTLTLGDEREQADAGKRVIECLVEGMNTRRVRAELEAKRSYQRVVELLGRTPGADEVRGTMWDAANTVTYWVDHERGRDASAAIESALWGQGRELKVRAMEVADRYSQTIK